MGRHSSDAGLDWRAAPVAAARAGEHPLLLARLSSGWAVLADTQFLPGYCLLHWIGATPPELVAKAKAIVGE